MKQQPLQIAIVGGGMGGLCLAQGLRKAGVSVAVYERDESPSSRPQGFRIHISPEGSRALHACLPNDLWEVFDATGGVSAQGFSIVTEQLRELLHFSERDAPQDAIAQHRSISRITLRRVLLAGLDGNVHFGKRFVRYEWTAEKRVRAHFEDGTTAEADVLVGADGVRSRVRRQYLPDAEPVDTGVVGIGGRIALTDGILALAPPQLLDGPVMVMPPAPCSLFLAMWRRARKAADALERLGIFETLEGDEDYLLLALGGRMESFGLQNPAGPPNGAELKEILRRKAAGWHPNLRKLIELAPEEEFFLNPLRTSIVPTPWKPSTVTLLGDAIHSMTPYRGIGGNVALRDAALLASLLAEAQTGSKSVTEAIGEYEREMRKYAFAAVAASKRAMEQFTGERKYPMFPLMKTAMRAVNAMPAVKMKLARA